MSRIFNFSAGPAVLPADVMQQVKDDIPSWQGTGMSSIEVSHRGKEFMAIARQSEADLRE